MGPDSGNESEKGAPVMRLSRLGGAITPPSRFVNDEPKVETELEAEQVSEPVAEAKEEIAVETNYLETPDSSKKMQSDVPISEEDSSIEKRIFNSSQDSHPRDDIMLEESLSFEISMNGERIAAKKQEKSDAINPGEVRAGKREAEAATAADTESLVRRHETVLPKSGFVDAEPVATNWSDVLKQNKFTDMQRSGVEATLRAASIRQGKRLEVDYADKIDLSSKKFERPFVIHFVSLRQEETRRKIEAQNEVMHQLQREVAEKPIEISRADRDEAAKVVPEETHSDDKLMPAYPITVHQPMNKWIAFAIIAVIVIAIGCIVFGDALKKKTDDAAKGSDMMAAFIGGDATVEMTGTSSVKTLSDEHESKFDMAWNKSSARMHIWREGLDYSVQDNGTVSIKIDDMSKFTEIANKMSVGNSGGVSEKDKQSFVRHLEDQITGRWYNLSDANLKALRKKLDSRYGGEIDCLGFLNSDFRKTFAKINFGVTEAKDFTLSYKSEEWSNLITDLGDSKAKDGFVRCWRDYDVTIDAKVSNDKITSVDVKLESDKSVVKINAAVKDDAELAISDAAKHKSYEDLLESLQEPRRQLLHNAAYSDIRSECRTVETECAKQWYERIDKSVNDAGDTYFYQLFGLIKN